MLREHELQPVRSGIGPRREQMGPPLLRRLARRIVTGRIKPLTMTVIFPGPGPCPPHSEGWRSPRLCSRWCGRGRRGCLSPPDAFPGVSIA